MYNSSDGLIETLAAIIVPVRELKSILGSAPVCAWKCLFTALYVSVPV